MSLRPLRQTEQVNVDYMCPWTQERGGCLTLATASGTTFAQYAYNPAGTFAVGIQLNDIEWMNLSRQYHRTFSHPAATTDVPFGIVGAASQGDFITDWIFLINQVFPGDAAYVGPSGTFTNSASFGGPRVGTFISSLTHDPHRITFRGLGFSREYIDPISKQTVWENDPRDRIYINTPGYIKIRVDIKSRSRT